MLFSGRINPQDLPHHFPHGQMLEQRNPGITRAAAWLERNRARLRGQALGPIAATVQVADAVHARALESHIPSAWAHGDGERWLGGPVATGTGSGLDYPAHLNRGAPASLPPLFICRPGVGVLCGGASGGPRLAVQRAEGAVQVRGSTASALRIARGVQTAMMLEIDASRGFQMLRRQAMGEGQALRGRASGRGEEHGRLLFDTLPRRINVQSGPRRLLVSQNCPPCRHLNQILLPLSPPVHPSFEPSIVRFGGNSDEPVRPRNPISDDLRACVDQAFGFGGFGFGAWERSHCRAMALRDSAGECMRLASRGHRPGLAWCRGQGNPAPHRPPDPVTAARAQPGRDAFAGRGV